jgi:hypothetical protein
LMMATETIILTYTGRCEMSRKQYRVLYDPIDEEVYVRYNRRGSQWKSAQMSGATVELAVALLDGGSELVRRLAMVRYLGYTEAVLA